MSLFHNKTSLRVLCSFLLLFSSAVAQLGDRKDKKGTQQIDPIPSEQIPPSPYLDLDAATKAFQLVDGYVIEPVAAGKDVYMAVALAFDADGRAWTAEMTSYMPNLDGEGEDKPNGRIRILEDTNGDGKVDKVTTFLDGLILPRAVAVTHDGCLYTSGDALLFIKRHGLKPVGKPVVIDREYARGGNPEHKGNGLLYGHDNWYYSAKSNARYRRINGEWVKQSTTMRGQWGIAKDNAGRLYHNNNSTMLVGDQFIPNFFYNNPQYAVHRMPSQRLGTNHVQPIRITPGVNRAYLKNTLDKDGKLAQVTAACGVHVYRGDNFPEEMQGMAFICEPAGELIKAVKVERDSWNKGSGSHPYGNKEFLATTDEWFLPCNIYTAPDGTMWILDMYFGLLQHRAYMTTYLRKQYASRKLDKPQPSTGRIYRVRYQKNSVAKVPQLGQLKSEGLVAYLSHPNGTVRDTAQRLIVELADRSVSSKLVNLVANNNKPMGQIHALWALEGLGVFEEKAFTVALNSSNQDVVRTALNILAITQPRTAGVQKAIQAVPHHPSTLHALVRAMAANKLTERALGIIAKNNKVAFIREAFVSGLGADAKIFAQQSPDIKDKKLRKHLVKVTQKETPKTLPEGAHLKGAALVSFKRGKEHYITKAACFGCHGSDGKGMPNLGPPLANSEWVTESSERLAKILLHGMTGPLTVNNKRYTPAAAMPGIKDNTSLSDKDIADVMTYIRNSWGNKASAVDPRLVEKARSATKNRVLPYTEKELR